MEIVTLTPEQGEYSALAEISGVRIGMMLEDAEDEIIEYTKAAFASYGNVELGQLNKADFASAMYQRCNKVQDFAIDAFCKRNDELFKTLESSLIQGFKLGIEDTAKQLGEPDKELGYDATVQGKSVAQSARQRILLAQAKAVDDAVARLGQAALTIVTLGAGIWGAHDLFSAFDKTYVADLGSGLTGLATQRGSRLALTGYAEGIARESSHMMRLQGESAAAVDAGYTLVQIHTHNPCCDKCLPFNNAVLVDDWFAGAQPDNRHELLSRAIEQGLFHWNCRCVKRIYREGGYIKYNNIGKDSKVLKGYELEQEMRRIERGIRIDKLARQASLQGDTASYCDMRIAHRQQQLRELTKYAKDNGYPVYRQNWREQIGEQAERYSTYHIKDIESSIKFKGEGETKVSNVVNTAAYAKKFDNLVPEDLADKVKSSGRLKDVALAQSRKLLEDRSGSDKERAIIIDLQHPEINYMTEAGNLSHRVPYDKTYEDMSTKGTGRYVTIHNHPNSSPPSIDDILCLVKRTKVDFGVVLCHNGDVYKYYFENQNKINSNDIFDKTSGVYEKYKSLGYTEYRAQEEALNAIKELHILKV